MQNENYAQVDDHHFEMFNSEHSEKVAHIVAQQMSAGSGKASQADVAEPQKTLPVADSARKKHGWVTVLNALERSRTSTPITGT